MTTTRRAGSTGAISAPVSGSAEAGDFDNNLNVSGRDELTGEAICAFVVLKGARPLGEAAAKMIKELQDHVAKEIGPIAKPKDIRFGENLPKTRSGKIMRRILRKIAEDAPDQLGDTSTLADPSVVASLVRGRLKD